MTFHRLSEYFSKLEATTLRNQMTQILAELFKESQASEIGKLCYLLQGRVAPLFEAIEFGIADKMIIRAIAGGLGASVEEVTKIFKKEGDLGKAVEKFKTQSAKIKSTAQSSKLNIGNIFAVLYEVATSGGAGSQEKKIRLLGDLLKTVDPLSARYIVRITLAKLRLGFSDMTILDALSWMVKGSKELRPAIEEAYNVRPDLSYIAATVKAKGIKGLTHVVPTIGTPIRMARAERLSTTEEIIKKIGECAVEPKLDGFRLQVHYSKLKTQNSRPTSHGRSPGGRAKLKTTTQNLKLLDDEPKEFVRLFSRNLEDVTLMYPDVVDGIIKQIEADEAILEGEAIAYNPDTGEYLPFQETVQRKRKYDIESKAKEIPLKLIIFELLYANGESFLRAAYKKRRQALSKIIRIGETVILSEARVVSDPKIMNALFLKSVSDGLEGIIAKKLDGIYRAGARDWNWIKLKRSYESKLNDTVDVVVMGYDFGQGKRTGFGIGDFLVGVYDEKKETFVTMSKIGTGLTDEEWRELKVKSQKSKVKSKPKNYEVDKMMECDMWVEPKIVVEVRADEITRSPVHTAGRVMKASKNGNAFDVFVPGYALRFPRLERFRDDKKSQDATTLAEIAKMYKQQGKS